MPEPRPIRKVLILGGGTAGWMTASALATLLPQLEISLVESDDIGTVGVGEATIPQIHLFTRMLGIGDSDILRETQATYKLGIEFDGWREPGKAYLHPFGSYGEPYGGAAFHQIWLARNRQGTALPLDQYNLTAQACRAGRYTDPAHHDPRSPLSRLFSAWHFDAGLFAGLLRRIAEARGVTRHEGKVSGHSRCAETGDITSLTLEDGRSFEADLYLDCSGFRSLLLGGALDVGYTGWTEHLPNDRAIALPSSPLSPLPAFTRATAREAGWQWRIPLQHRTGNGYVFSSAYLDEDKAMGGVEGMVEGEILAEPRLLRFTPGHRKRMWQNNVVAIGLSAGFLEPLESTSIHLIQQAIMHLANLLPRSFPAPAATAEFNRTMTAEFEAIRDFLFLHFWANRRPEPYWRDRRETPLPETLKRKVEMWREAGHIARDGHDLFAEASWVAVLLGQGLVPESCSPLVDTLPQATLDRHLQTIPATIARTVSAMPDHARYIRERMNRTART